MEKVSILQNIDQFEYLFDRNGKELWIITLFGCLLSSKFLLNKKRN